MKHECRIDSVRGETFSSVFAEKGVVNLAWNSNVGFGEFQIIFDKDGKPHFYSEYMCSQDDKEFAKLLFNKMIDEAIVEE